MRTAAHFSVDRLFRYWLLRVWDERLPIYASIGVNPSKADEVVNDATVRKDIGFGARAGYGGLLKLNVGAYCSTDPAEWRRAADPIGPLNTAAHLVAYVEQFKAVEVVAAWGKNGNYQPKQCAAIIRQFKNLWCFGRNGDGTPRHTLMLPYSTPMEIFA